jgi:hypothetical protein
MKKKTKPTKWVVARSIYNNTDYEVWAICSSKEECKEWISNNVPFAADQDDFFYFQRS